MTNTRKFLLAGAALALTATAALAANLPGTASRPLPRMVQTVIYSGEAQPRFAALEDGASHAIFVSPVFADMTRMMAAMDRDMDRLMEETGALMAMPDNIPRDAVLMNVPRGNDNYAVTAIGGGGRVCGREVTITSTGNGAKPKVVSRSFGDCNALKGLSPGAGAAVSQPSAADAGNGLIQARFVD